MSGEPQPPAELQPEEPQLSEQPLQLSSSLAEEEERHLRQLASSGGSAEAREAVRADLERRHFVSAGLQIEGGSEAGKPEEAPVPHAVANSTTPRAMHACMHAVPTVVLCLCADCRGGW